MSGKVDVGEKKIFNVGMAFAQCNRRIEYEAKVSAPERTKGAL